MSKSTSQRPTNVNNRAEGNPDEREYLEPPAHLRTSTIPAITSSRTSNASETGLNFVVELDVDGKDISEEAQDARLIRDEKISDTEQDKNETMSVTPQRSPILIVEDTVELAEVIQATLEGMGLDSVFETHGKTGLEQLKAIEPDLLIMDIGLPDITGWKMLDHIKAHYQTSDRAMPTIIVITAYGDPANRVIGKLQNIHSYLIKPFTPDQVERVVGMALRGEKPDDPIIGTASTE